MNIKDILTPENTRKGAQADSKKAVIELISKLMAQNLPDVEYDEIFDSLTAREKLGSTSIAHGVAIPHGRLDVINKPLGAFVVLQKPIDFASIDNQLTDIFFALIVPTEESELHLDILASLAKKFSSKALREQLHKAKDDSELYQIITEE